MSEFQVGAAALEGGAMHDTAALRYLDELFRYAMVLTRKPMQKILFRRRTFAD